MEKDNERYGAFKNYDFGARIYDPMIARWASIDPLAKKYPFTSPYNFALNSPIQAKDPDGKEVWIVHRSNDKNNSVVSVAKYSNGKLYFLSGDRKDPYVLKVAQDISQNVNTGDNVVKGVLQALESNKENIHVITNYDHGSYSSGNSTRPFSARYDDYNHDGSADFDGTVIQYDPDSKTSSGGDARKPRVGLGHEQKHAYNMQEGKVVEGKTENGISLEEVDAVNFENRIRKTTGDKPRTTYGDKKIPTKNIK